MKEKKKAFISAVIFFICALIWTIVVCLNIRKLAGTSVLILMICTVITSFVNAIIWFVRYVRIRKRNKNTNE